MPHDVGLANLHTVLLVNSIQTLTISSICEITKLVLRCNVLEFKKEYFNQTSGTAIGAELATS